MYVTLRPRFGAKHNTPRWPARCMTERHRGHIPWKAGSTSSPAQGPVRATTSSLSSSMVSRTPSSASPIASTISSVCEGVRRSPGLKGLGPPGIADNAAVQKGSSATGRKWIVPRGPYVLTRLGSSPHSASRTSCRVAPSMRSPTDSSAADITCACAPSIASTTSPGPASPGLAEARRNCRSMRRALTALHVTVGGALIGGLLR